MSTVGILGAMDQEVALLKSSLSELEEITWRHLTFFKGQLHGHTVILVKCGIGKVAAAVATTALIDHFSPDCVINTGSAGGFDTQLEIGDVVIGTQVVHHDANLTHFGYKLGQMAGMPEHYESAQNLVEAAQAAADDTLSVTHTQGLICTGDAFIGSDEAAQTLREQFPEIAAAEMEASAIAQTAYMLSVPCLIIRSLSDIAGKESSMSFEQYLEVAAKNSAELVMATIGKL